MGLYIALGVEEEERQFIARLRSSKRRAACKKYVELVARLTHSLERMKKLVWTGWTKWKGGCKRGRRSCCRWPLYAAAAGQNEGPRGMFMFTNSKEPLALMSTERVMLKKIKRYCDKS
jgi:hypothetical protein